MECKPIKERDSGSSAAFTASMGQFLEHYRKTDNRKALNAIEDGMDFYERQFLKMPAGTVRAHSIHVAIDESLEFEKKQKPNLYENISCKAGCSACCHNRVIVSPDEAALLVYIAKEQKIEIDRDLLSRQATFKGTDHEWFLLPDSENKCVFLGADNLCKVYEHRPNACRKYLVESPPEQCSVKHGNQSVAVRACLDVEIIASAALDIDHECNDLPILLERELEKWKIQ